MTKAANNKVSRVVRPFASNFYRSNGRLPTPKEVMDAFSDTLEPRNYDAARKILKRMSKQDPSEYAPLKPVKEVASSARNEPPPTPASGPVSPQQRLANVRYLLGLLEDNARERSDVDAVAYDKLTRLERQLKSWIKQDAEEAREAGRDKEAPAAIEAILTRYKQRKAQGLNKGGPRNEV